MGQWVTIRWNYLKYSRWLSATFGLLYLISSSWPSHDWSQWQSILGRPNNKKKIPSPRDVHWLFGVETCRCRKFCSFPSWKNGHRESRNLACLAATSSSSFHFSEAAIVQSLLNLCVHSRDFLWNFWFLSQRLLRCSVTVLLAVRAPIHTAMVSNSSVILLRDFSTLPSLNWVPCWIKS